MNRYFLYKMFPKNYNGYGIKFDIPKCIFGHLSERSVISKLSTGTSFVCNTSTYNIWINPKEGVNRVKRDRSMHSLYFGLFKWLYDLDYWYSVPFV